MTNKICSMCKAVKPITDFNSRKRSRDGLQSRCRECSSRSNKTWQACNPDSSTLRMQVWRSENPDRDTANARAWRKENASKVCAASQAYRSRNPDKVQAYKVNYRYINGEKERLSAKAYRRKFPDKSRASSRAYRMSNPEKCRAFTKAWERANPHLVSARASRRRAAKLRATPAWSDPRKISGFYAESARLTRETGVEHHVDHIVPLQSKLVCGLHNEFNLQILPGHENVRKGNRHWPDMP
jgi:hypothetical protein